MAIYVDNLGDSNLPVSLNNPQEGEALVWDPAAGAFVNAPQSGSTEVIQDTVAEMLEVDPDGTQVSLRLVSNYDDATGKLTFNVVADGNGSGGGGGIAGITVKENGATRGLATTLDFSGATVGFNGGVATITGLLDSIGIRDTNVNVGDVKNFDFHGFDLAIEGDTVRVMAPDLSGIITSIPVQESGLDKGAVTSLNFVNSTVTVSNGVATIIGSTGGSGGSSYVLPVASGVTLGGVKVDGSTITINSNGVISAVGGGSGGVTLSDVGNYLTANGYATQTYVQGQVGNLINGAPSVLDTLNELAAALSNDPNFAASITAGLAGKLNLTGGTMTGTLTLASAPVGNLDAATKGYVDQKVSTSLSNLPPTVVTLDDLEDVDTSGVTTGQVLGWNGTTWVATNNTGLKGDTGDTGAQGPAGLSVSAASISLTGNLLLTMSNGATINAGSVAGLSNAVVNGTGRLILTKQDGSTIDAGNVVGPQGEKGDTGATGATGATGSTGPTGVGFSTAAVDGSGRLIITKTDNSVVDAGSVVGPQGVKGDKGDTGATGATGPAGNGIFSAVVDGDGNLILTLDDATSINAGNTVGPQGPQGAQGPAGRSIASGGVVVDGAGNLQVTLTDGSTINAGYVVGPQGSTGPQGVKGDKGDTGATGATGPQGLSYTVNGLSDSVQIFGLSSTTRPGFDFEVDLSNRANRLATARTISLAGKVTGLTSFDGSGNVSITTALSGVTTNDVSEGTNQYFTQARARASLTSAADSSITSLISYDDATGVIRFRANTSYITEGTNLYFTNTRADARADSRIAAASINALADVDTATTAPTNGQVLTWTGSAWTPSTVSGGSGAVSSVNTKTGAVTLNTDDVAEGTSNLYYTTTRWDQRLASRTTDNLTEGSTNKYFSNTLARNALAAGTGLSYNSSTGTFTLNANTDQVSEGSANLFYTNTRFDTRLGQSTLKQLSDVADTTPTAGQALAWNGSSWAPTTISGGGGGGGGGTSGVFRATVQVDYDASGNLANVTVLSGGISAVIATATSTTATVTFTFTDSVCAPLGVQVYGYQRASNVYVTRSIGSDFSTRTIAGGGSSGSPTAFSAFDPSVNTMTLSLTRALTGASANVGQTTHCVVHFLLSNV